MEKPAQKQILNASLQENLTKVRETTGNSTDVIIREIRIGKDGNIRAGIIYTEGLTDSKDILEDLMLEVREADLDQYLTKRQNPILLLKDYAVAVGDVKDLFDFETLFTAVLSGDTVILLDGYPQGIVACRREWKTRGVTEPASQSVIRGPREGFTETLRTNTALIRRKIRDPHLWLETSRIGRLTKTDVAMMYVKGIANEKVIEEVRKRLERIDIDGILESGYIEELIQDETYTPFPTIYHTERPDAVAAGLLEGRIAILVDGTPFVLLVPAVFISVLTSLL